jgi:protocatechuate 3,4-dioxygenase beta subunit
MKAALLTLLVALAPCSLALPREDPASIEGVVVDQGTGSPVARARALLAEGRSVDPKEALSVTADANGRFIISGVTPGVYRLFVGHPDYVPSEYGQRLPGGSGTLIVATAGEVIRADVSLTPAASIYGKVANQHGAPVPRFVVKAFRAHYERGERVFRGGQYAITEESGEFRIFGLAPGWYFLTAVPAEEYSALPLNAGLMNWPAYYGGATEDDSTPFFLLPRSAFDAGTLVAPEGMPTRVRGMAVNAATGKADPAARVVLGRQRRWGVETAGLAAPALKTGFFELAGAAPGNYVIDAVTPALAGSASFQARGEDIDDLKVLLYPRVSLKGRVRGPGMAKRDLSAILPRLRVVLDTGRTTIEAAADSRGVFTLVNVPVGAYRVSLAGVPANVFLKKALSGSVDVLEKGILVVPKSNAPVEIEIGSASNAFSVIALDAKRRAVPGAVVVLVPKSRRLDLYRSAIVDDDGNVRFENVPPGAYRAYSWEYIEDNAWLDADIVSAYEQSGESVTIRESGIEIATVTVNRLWPENAP